MLESKNVDRAGTTFGNILTDRLIIRLANPDDAEEYTLTALILLKTNIRAGSPNLWRKFVII